MDTSPTRRRLPLEEFLKSVNMWQSYKQERGCLMHFARLANYALLKDEESARDYHVLACNFAKYLPIKKIHRQSQQQTFPNLVINNPITPSVFSYTTLQFIVNGLFC